MDKRIIKIRTDPSREECLSAIKMTLIRFNAFVQEMDSQHYYSPRKFTAEQRDFLYEMADRQYLRNMNAVLMGKQLEELDDEALETVLEKCRRLSDGFALCVDIPEGARIADGSDSLPHTDIADLSYCEKIKKAMEYSDVLNEILEEIGSIDILVAQMAAVSGVMVGLAATGYGAVAEALGLALLAVGAAFSGADLLKGIIGLVKFLTTVDDAKTEEDLKACGKLFGDAVAKIGVDGLFFALSIVGLKKTSARLTTRTVVDNSLNSRKWSSKKVQDKELAIMDETEIKTVPKTMPKNNFRFNETHCHDHLIYGEGIKGGQGGVNGAHNKNNFYKTINDKFEPIFNNEGLKFNINDCIESKVAHPTISGIEEIKYRLPAMNQNNILNKGTYKKIRTPKTVYDSSIISDEQMLQWGKEAMQNGTKIGKKVFGENSKGLKFIGYLDEQGVVKNFYPVFNIE